jgi:hypothetical protein
MYAQLPKRLKRWFLFGSHRFFESVEPGQSHECQNGILLAAFGRRMIRVTRTDHRDRRAGRGGDGAFSSGSEDQMSLTPMSLVVSLPLLRRADGGQAAANSAGCGRPPTKPGFANGDSDVSRRAQSTDVPFGATAALGLKMAQFETSTAKMA